MSKFKSVQPQTSMKQNTCLSEEHRRFTSTFFRNGAITVWGTLKNQVSKRRKTRTQKPVMRFTVETRQLKSKPVFKISPLRHIQHANACFLLGGVDNERPVIVTDGNTSHVSSNYNVVASKVQNRRGEHSKRRAFGFELSLHSRAAPAVGVNVGKVTCPVMPVIRATFLFAFWSPFSAELALVFSPHWAIVEVWCLPVNGMVGLARRMFASDADKREWHKTSSASVNLNPTHQHRRVGYVTGSGTDASQWEETISLRQLFLLLLFCEVRLASRVLRYCQLLAVNSNYFSRLIMTEASSCYVYLTQISCYVFMTERFIALVSYHQSPRSHLDSCVINRQV